MQIDLSWIWTCVAMSFSYDDNHYNKCLRIVTVKENGFGVLLKGFHEATSILL